MIQKEKNPYVALKVPKFKSYLGIRFFFTMAYQMQAVCIGYYVYELTKSALALGMIGLCEAIPALSIALYGGYVADKSEKKKLMTTILAAVFICSLALFTITNSAVQQHIPHSYVLTIIYISVFGIGLARGFYGPTAFTIMTQIVPKSLYTNSATWNSSSYQTASILGPAIGGLLYGYIGITATFGVILALLITSFGFIISLDRYEPIYQKKEKILESLKSGIKFVFTNKMMLGAMSLDLFSVFFGGAVALLPVFAHDILHVGAKGLGVMRAIDSLGAVLTMFLMTKYSPMNRPWRNLLIAVFGFGLTILCFAFSRNFYLTLVILFLQGAFDSVSVLVRSTIMQLITPDEMRGRVSAVNSMFIGSSNEIGAFESGLTAKLMGTVRAVVFGGCMTLGVVIITYYKTKELFDVTLKNINAPAKNNL